jgi:predicted ATP-dependent endonuclease of OLD family
VFKFKVKDKSNSNKSRTFSINSRSKGFQWFFNYMVKLKFNPNYSGDTLENALFLLDEPGSYLHSSAQIELLKELKKVSNNNQVIFCTHSQFLLDPKTIELGSIRIAEKTGSEVKSFNFGDCKAKRDKGALTPIYQALNLNFAHDFMGDIVILEGITDFYLFELLKKYKHISQHIKFILVDDKWDGFHLF